MISEEIELNEFLDRGRDHAGRDRSRRIHHPAAGRASEPHHRARRAPQPRSRSRRISAASTRHLPPDRDLTEPERCSTRRAACCAQEYFDADVGITGANFLVAETGTSIIVTNEGNGDLTQTLPQGPHRARLDREDRADARGRRDRSCACWRARRPARSCPSTRRCRPARAAPAIPTGRSEYHVVLLDNGRSAMLGTEFQDMLRCIRCGACMNHCPVYHAVGGHAYGWVYPGPMGAVLTPVADRHRQGRASAQRLDLLRPLRKRVPDAHSAAEDDAALARARVRARPQPGDAALRPGALGVLRQAAARSTGWRRRSPCRCSPCSAARKGRFG